MFVPFMFCMMSIDFPHVYEQKKRLKFEHRHLQKIMLKNSPPQSILIETYLLQPVCLKTAAYNYGLRVPISIRVPEPPVSC